MKNPLYRQVADGLDKYIETHALAPGDRLPSMRELCHQFQVSEITIRAALKVLTDRGQVESRERSGVFVSKPQLQKRHVNGQKTFAIIVPKGNHAYDGGIICGATEKTREHGYNIIVANSGDHTATEASLIRDLAQQVSGLIVFPAFDSENYSAYISLLEKGVPFVFVDRSIPGLSAPLIATDNELGGYLATSHLLQTGRREIFALSARSVSSTQERLDGFRRAMKENGLPIKPSSILRSNLFKDANEAVGYLLTKELITNARPKEPFAIFALTEYIARSSYAALREAGLRIPEDVAIVGFDDISALYFEPPLTSVRQDPQRIGAIAAEVLLDMKIRPLKAPIREIRLKPELIIRSSTDTQSKFSFVGHLLDQINQDERLRPVKAAGLASREPVGSV